MPGKMTHIDYFMLTFFTLCALGMGAYLAYNDPNISADSFLYLTVAENWLAGKGYIHSFAPSVLVEPAYGLLSCFLKLFTHDIEIASNWVSVLSYTLLVPLVYATVHRINGRWSAIYTTILVTFNPDLLIYSYQAMTDVPFTTFCFLSFALLLKVLYNPLTHPETTSSAGAPPDIYEENKKGHDTVWFIVLGISLAWLILIRPVGWMVAFLAFACLFLPPFYRIVRKKQKINQFYKPAISLASFALIIIPWLLFLHNLNNTWVLTPRQIRVQVDGSKIMLEDAQDWLEENSNEQPAEGAQLIPSYFLYADRIADLVIPFLSLQAGLHFAALAPFALVATLYLLMFVFSKNKKSVFLENIAPYRQKLLFPLILALVFCLPGFIYLARKVYIRYLLPTSMYSLIILGLLTVTGIEILFKYFKRERLLPAAMLLIVAMVIFPLFSPQIQDSLQQRDIPVFMLKNALTFHHDYYIEHMAGVELREKTYDKALVNETYVAVSKGRCNMLMFQFYGRQLSAMPPSTCLRVTSLDEIDTFIEQGGDYLVLTRSIAQNPAFSALWEDPQRAGEYNLEGFGGKYNLYQIYAVKSNNQ